MAKKVSVVLAIIITVLGMTACGANAGQDTVDGIVNVQAGDRADIQSDALEPEDKSEAKEAVGPENEFEDEETGGQTEMKMNVQIGDYDFTATLESNAAVDELVNMMKEGPVTINMDDYSGFEKVGSLGRSLTTSNSQTTTTAGDIVLYNGSNIVMFYGSNSWSYTRIGKIDDLTDWEKALGKGSITAVFTIAE